MSDTNTMMHEVRFDPKDVVEAERNTWNRCAGTYLDCAAPITNHAVEILIDAAGLTSKSRALDAACGPGHITRLMADTGASATGVDLTPNMIEMAGKLNPHIDFRVANVDELPFDSGCFDAVLVNYAIHHFARPDRAVREIHRVLKPGGRFVFAGVLEHFGFWAFMSALMAHHTMEALAHGPLYLEATREDYEKLVADAGFDSHEVTEQVIPLHQDDLEAVLMTGWEMCDLKTLPGEVQDKIRAATVENAAAYQTETGYDFPDRIVVGVARK